MYHGTARVYINNSWNWVYTLDKDIDKRAGEKERADEQSYTI